jgi:tetratricopeptide (TPR) repeat protein
LAAANNVVQDAIKGLIETSQYFDAAIAAVAAKHPGKSPHLQLLYEAAWTSRLLGQEEVMKARATMQEELRKKLQAEADQKAAPTGKPAAIVNAPEPLLTAVPQQPFEKKARDLYAALIQTGGEAPQAQIARFELAETHAIREEWDPAIALLAQVIDLEPAVELEEKARLRLGSCYLAKKDYDKAAGHFDALATSTKPLVAAEARQRAAEVWIAAGKWDNAVKQLTPLRDAEPLRNLPGVSDRGLLRLAYALRQLQQWDASRQACELLQQRFPQSPWLHEARFAQAGAFQGQGQHDQAVNHFRLVTQATSAEVGAKSQLQIGVSLLAQKKFPEALSELLIVPYTYDYPEPSAQALVEAAKVLVELKQTDRALQLLKKVVQDYPQTPSAESARTQLTALQPK